MNNIISWIEYDGYKHGRSDCETLDKWTELKERMIYYKALTPEEADKIDEYTWEKYFQMWKMSESEGISDDEWDSI